MRVVFNRKFNRDTIIIHPGEFHVTKGPKIISTVLGSCISVCLIDNIHKIGGMNHFMLPGRLDHKQFYVDDSSGRYGMFAMDLLIGSLLKKGAARKYFSAKVFGGGSVINFRKTDGNVPQQNIEFARKFLKMEGIKVASENVGGNYGRKILFFPDTGKVLMKKIEIAGRERVFQEEERYKSKIFKEKSKEKTDLTLF